jgi:hypothetical protein
MKINQSIVKGSRIGSTLFTMFARDSKTVDNSNYSLKYKDDSN